MASRIAETLIMFKPISNANNNKVSGFDTVKK
jgi:hypothetical protein